MAESGQTSIDARLASLDKRLAENALSYDEYQFLRSKLLEGKSQRLPSEDGWPSPHKKLGSSTPNAGDEQNYNLRPLLIVLGTILGILPVGVVLYLVNQPVQQAAADQAAQQAAAQQAAADQAVQQAAAQQAAADQAAQQAAARQAARQAAQEVANQRAEDLADARRMGISLSAYKRGLAVEADAYTDCIMTVKNDARYDYKSDWLPNYNWSTDGNLITIVGRDIHLQNGFGAYSAGYTCVYDITTKAILSATAD